jgi:hypothetical protein
MEGREDFDKKDESDIYYNRACCRAEEAAKATDPNIKAKAVKLAVDDLRRSVELLKENAQAAKGDKDFLPLKDDPGFKSIVVL